MNTSSTRVKSYACFLDIQTGTIKKLTKDDLGLVIMRDSELYKTYEKVKPGKKDKNLFKFIADFNSRNPTYLPSNNSDSIVEEE